MVKRIDPDNYKTYYNIRKPKSMNARAERLIIIYIKKNQQILAYSPKAI